MKHDGIQLFGGLVQQPRGLPGQIQVACAVETVAPDAKLFVEGEGKAVGVGLFGHGGVEAGVKDGDLEERLEAFQIPDKAMKLRPLL